MRFLLFGLATILAIPSPATAELLVMSQSSVNRYDAHTGEFLGQALFAGSGTLFTGITSGADGTLYVSFVTTDSGEVNGVRRYDPATFALLDTMQFPSGELIPWIILGGSSDAFSPLFGPDGNYYAVDRASSDVRRFDGTTGASLGSFATDGLDGPGQMAFGPDGNLYVGSRFLGINRYNGSTGALTDTYLPISFPSEIGSNEGFAFLTSGDLFFRGSATAGPDGAAFGPFSTSGTFEFGPDGLLYEISGSSIVRRDGATGAFVDSFISGVGGANGLVFTVIPEPSSLILALASLAAPLYFLPVVRP